MPLDAFLTEHASKVESTHRPTRSNCHKREYQSPVNVQDWYEFDSCLARSPTQFTVEILKAIMAQLSILDVEP